MRNEGGPPDERAAEALIGLIEICKDGEVGYRNAAENGKNSDLTAQFRAFSEQRERFIEELRREVTLAGGTPENADTASRALHRGWMILRSATAGEEPDALIEACEKGEDEAQRQYRDALESGVLPPSARRVVERQFEEIRRTHDVVSRLQSQLRR